MTDIAVLNLKASDIVSTSIEITEDAINLFINDQYNRIGFVNNINGSISGVTYDITLYRPNIKLLENQAKVVFGFKIVSNVFTGTLEFDDDFSFTVPPVDDLSVIGVSNAFTDKVNALSINAVLKTAIISAWKSLKLEAYPMGLAKKIVKSEYLNERSINIVDPYFSISFKSVPQKLQIELNTYLEGVAPQFGIRLRTDGILDVGSKSKITVAEFELQWATGGQIYKYTPNVICDKNSTISIKHDPSTSFGVWIVRILFKTSNTFYLRYYKTLCVPNDRNDMWDWSPLSQYNLN